MKLYTEEQLHNTVKAVANYLDDINLTRAQENIEKHLKALKPIELPSDEEIEEMALQENDDLSPAEEYAIYGAKWMRDKIGGKDEQ